MKFHEFILEKLRERTILCIHSSWLSHFFPVEPRSKTVQDFFFYIMVQGEIPPGPAEGWSISNCMDFCVRNNLQWHVTLKENLVLASKDLVIPKGVLCND